MATSEFFIFFFDNLTNKISCHPDEFHFPRAEYGSAVAAPHRVSACTLIKSLRRLKGHGSDAIQCAGAVGAMGARRAGHGGGARYVAQPAGTHHGAPAPRAARRSQDRPRPAPPIGRVPGVAHIGRCRHRGHRGHTMRLMAVSPAQRRESTYSPYASKSAAIAIATPRPSTCNKSVTVWQCLYRSAFDARTRGLPLTVESHSQPVVAARDISSRARRVQYAGGRPDAMYWRRTVGQ